MNLGKVSIIMPVYNQEKYIKDAIESVLSQSYDNFELIIINDGSIDDTLNVINNYKNNENIKIINYKNNKGKVFAVNKGFENSKGDFITLLAGDDVLPINSLELRVKSLGSDYMISFGNMYMCNKKLEIVKPMFDYKFNEITWEEDKIRLSNDNMLSGGSLILKRKLADKVFPIPKDLEFEDWWISFVSLYYAKKIKYMNEYVLFYRIHDSNDNGNFNKIRTNSEVKRLYRRKLNYYKEFKKFLDKNVQNEKELITIINKNIDIYNKLTNSKVIPLKYIKFLGISKYLKLNLISKNLDYVPRLIVKKYFKKLFR